VAGVGGDRGVVVAEVRSLLGVVIFRFYFSFLFLNYSIEEWRTCSCFCCQLQCRLDMEIPLPTASWLCSEPCRSVDEAAIRLGRVVQRNDERSNACDIRYTVVANPPT
jgi:hypothetical protein